MQLENFLHAAYAVFKNESTKDMAFLRAGEWMLDNFYVVRQTFCQVNEGLPVGFFNQLPKLDGTPLIGYPRIFALSWEWVGFSQSQIDLARTINFVQDYQQTTSLTIGELWALPNMLRIAILARLVNAAAELTGLEAPKSLSKIPSQFTSRRWQTRRLLPTASSACACSPLSIGKLSSNRPAGWRKSCVTIPPGSMREWILKPATIIAESSRNWPVTRSPVKSKSPSLQLNALASGRKKPRGGRRT
jgi:hypothetical protein